MRRLTHPRVRPSSHPARVMTADLVVATIGLYVEERAAPERVAPAREGRWSPDERARRASAVAPPR